MSRLIDTLQTLNILRLAKRISALERWKEQMSAELDAFKDEMNAETNQIGADVKEVARKLAEAIDAGDLHAIQQLRPSVDALHAAGDELHALAAPPEPTPV